MLQDRHKRVISYLRISVTDRCNFRCVYCMPAEGIALSPRSELLSFEEIARVARVGSELGLTKIRLTGGEPTVRRDLPQLVKMLASIDGIREVSLTTNAARLGELAEPLKAAGLARVNISLDTLQRDKMQEIARRDYYDNVMQGIEAAFRAGLTPLKFNTVVMRGVNDEELSDLVRFTHGYNAQLRFIEYMPMGAARFDEHNKVVTSEETRALLARDFDFVRESTTEFRTHSPEATDPARGWVCRTTGARVGFISSMSEHFCDSCNRMRLTAEGGLRPCLHQDAEVNVRELLRSDASDADIAGAFREAANLKWAGHHMTDIIPLYSAKEMVAIGG
ncbi:MAG TPA: GTP 3',8-cyclase MoaA [Abditibacteriaceae bacterium]|jgi:cyclic pyranopterin phosphate synthase